MSRYFINNLKIAFKYIYPKKNSFIQVLCSLILFILFFIIVLVNAVMTGMSEKIKQELCNAKGDINITLKSNPSEFNSNQFPFIKKTIPSFNTQVVLYKSFFAGSILFAYKETDLYYKLSSFNFTDPVYKSNLPGIFIGKNIAEHNNISVGDEIYVYSITNPTSQFSLLSIASQYVKSKVVVLGILKTQNFFLDSILTVTTIKNIKRILHDRKCHFNKLEIYSDSLDNSDIYAETIRESFPHLTIASWKDEYKPFDKALRSHHQVKGIFLNIFFTLIGIVNLICLCMFYFIKRKELGVLLSLGASRYLIFIIFVFSSMKYIILSGALGTTLSYLVVIYAKSIAAFFIHINIYDIFDPIVLFLTKIQLISSLKYILLLNSLNICATICLSIFISIWIVAKKSIYDLIN